MCRRSSLTLFLGLLTTRDGHTVSLSSALHLPRLFSSHSARPSPKHWICGDLSIGWRDYTILALFWILTLLIKGVFDYYVLWKVRLFNSNIEK